MVPIPIDPTIKDVVQPKQDTLGLPEPSRIRLEKAGIDLSHGYPYRPARPLYLDDATAIRGEPWDHNDAGARAAKTNPSKPHLLKAASKVTHLTTNIGTEIEGLQLKDLTDEQRDELALLIAERSVVFFRDQDISPQEQKRLGEHYGKIEVHPQVPQVPGVEGVTVRTILLPHIIHLAIRAPHHHPRPNHPPTQLTESEPKVIWPALQATERPASFRNPGGASRWHTDLVHELQPAGITHLHNDCIPTLGGDTLWASGYGAYEKLSPAFRQIIDGRYATYASAHAYLERGREDEGPKNIERVHPIVRVHPATGWKALWVNRAFTRRIVGLDKAESDVILGYLFDVYEKVSERVLYRTVLASIV